MNVNHFDGHCQIELCDSCDSDRIVSKDWSAFDWLASSASRAATGAISVIGKNFLIKIHYPSTLTLQSNPVLFYSLLFVVP